MNHLQELIQKLESQAFTYCFFWGHTPHKNGTITKSCLSQWWVATFEEHGIHYPSCEHYMMAKKAELFQDVEALSLILSATTPKEAKALGRQVKNFDTTIWNEHKYNIVKQANRLKFTQHQDLYNFLAQIKEDVIVEASPYDTIWGIGVAESHPMAQNPRLWQGENLLGFALTELRDEFKQKDLEIKYVKGDATAPIGSDTKIIVHVCNDIGGWGAGFVLALSKRWKEPETQFRAWFKSKENFELGAVQLVPVEEQLWVANLVGQRDIFNDAQGVPPIRYDAIKKGLETLADFALKHNASIHMPRIGCGLAGGKWELIEPLITSALLEKKLKVTVYDL